MAVAAGQELGHQAGATLGIQVYIQAQKAVGAGSVAEVCRMPEDMGWDAGVWQLEHLRQVVLELSELLVLLAPECTAENCGQMKATVEWVFLCAAHRVPRECCAIDYIIHNVEATTAVLNSRRWFPSRGSVPETAEKMFQSIARRLYRIFAHVYFHHRPIFDRFEASTHLYERFIYLVHDHNWIPEKLCIIPSDVVPAPPRSPPLRSTPPRSPVSRLALDPQPPPYQPE